ncbi:PREDICTED: 182 kDa tankyrase-1-binding protein [Haliaeetus leucocephalus]|uniref:182 kDa tankyrase-1-binding protein n=1 Tax=Haliaeetus leucocephalus TaxID=52644 RepID=UPI00053CAD71|nr:PREDICTED: 182 kDa tankyrase-1-binding protein [Haliaeetus leucocephalus]
MASQPQPLRPALPCASATGTGGAGLVAGSPEKGNARPKPPVRPKPQVLPKPAVPAKPSLPYPPPGPRHPRPELPSAEKMNRLAGPQPYSGGSSGGPLRRPSFTLKSPETPNGKVLPSPLLAATEDPGSTPGEEVPPAPLTPSRKGLAPFKVTPVPVATKPERFPGTTVEEILAKIDSREGPGSPDRARLSPFCPDSSSRFGSKTFTAFRRRPSGEADGALPGEARQTPQPAVGELGTGDDGHPIAEMSGSPPAGPSCAGDPRGRRRPPSPPDLSSLRPGALGPPGSPRPPVCPAPGAPFQPAEPSASAPGSPDASLELPAPGSPTLAPGSPESPAQPPAEVLATSIQAPGAPSSAAEPRLGISCSPGSPHTPGEGSPDTASPPSTPELPPRVTCPPGSPEAAAEYPGPPSPLPEAPAKASRAPGSPEGPDDSPVSPQSPKGPNFSPPPPSRDSGLRRSSEGVLQPPTTGQGMGELGGSLSALPRPGDPLSEPSLGSESSWSLSQSFEWTFPSRGARRLASPPRSPIRETVDSGVSEEGESDREDPDPCPPRSGGDSGSEELGPVVAGSRGAEGAPCPGGPVAQREAEGSAEEEEEEGEAERGATMPCSPLCVTKPARDPAELEPPTQPGLLIEATPPDPATAANSAWAPVSDSPVSLQGPGGPGRAEGSSRGPDPHTDPGWLTELLASPGAHAAGRGSLGAEGPEDLLGWSRKDLCSEFGIGRPHQAGTFDWTREAVARESDWPGEMERDREFGTKLSWDSTCSVRDGDQQDGPFGTTRRDWGSDYKGTELMGEMRLGCSDWSKSHGTGEGCLQDQDFGAGKAKWGTGYGLDSAGSREEISSGKTDWSSSYGLGHGQQQDEEPSSRQSSWAGRYGSGDVDSQDREITPAWAGEYGTSDVEMKDRELTPNWASKYSSRDAETKDKDFTLGWAGRSSTGDAGTPHKEFSPSRPAWDSKYSTRDMESQDREFSPSRLAEAGEYTTRDMESQDREFSPSRLAEAGEYTTRDMESQDREFSPSRPAWDSEYRSRDMESQDREFSPSRLAWEDEHSTRDMESQDQEFSSSRPAWEDRYSTRDMETQDREFSPSRPAWVSEYSSTNTEKEEREFSPGRLSWAGEHSISQTELVDAFGVRKDDLPGSCASDPLAQEPGWGSTNRQEHSTTDSRDWAEELGGAKCQNQFGIIGTDRVPDPSSAGVSPDGSMSWAGGMRSGGLREPVGDWPRDLSFGSSDATSCLGTGDAGRVGLGQMAWGQSLGSLPAPGSSAQPQEAGVEEPGWSQHLDTASWSVELRDAEAKRWEWANAFGARCAARSRDFGAEEQSPGGDAGSVDGSIRLSDPSPPMGDALADSAAVECPQSEPSSPTEEERDLSALAAAPQSPRASPLSPEGAGGTLLDTESEEAPLDHLDGKTPPSWEEKRLSLGAPQPEGPTDHAGQEFTFLEDTEILDSSVYRSKANLGRKRRHRAPALRPGATSDGESWIFRDSTEPRPACPAASSDEEAAEQPKSRRVRASPSGKGVKVPLFPGLNTSALKAKLRGRNRSAEEGALPGDSKATPPKEPHVQRSKSCKIPGLSGKPLVLPPKPEKSSGSDASPPHWLQALKLKKKKP